MESSIETLLREGCIKEVTEIPYCCNPLTVAEGKKLRLVLDLRHVNEYLDFPKFKYENLKVAAKHLQKDNYFCTFDLKSGYHHIDIHPDDQKYLGFSWTFEDGTTRYFQFVVLPFGLASACYVFTKVTKPLVKKWRKSGMRCTMYLDDGICSAVTYGMASFHSGIIRNDLRNAGFTINHKKSMFEPSQLGKWLGFEIDTTKMMFFVPVEKINALDNLINLVINLEFTNAKTVARIAGRLISMSDGIGPLTRLFTRQMYRFIDERKGWYENRPVDNSLLSEFLFWNKNLRTLNGFHIKTNQATSKVVYSDASETGYGGYVVQKLGNVISRGDFKTSEKGSSSTYRELLAVKYILQSVGSYLRNERVQWYSDNYNVSRIIEVGSKRSHLH